MEENNGTNSQIINGSTNNDDDDMGSTNEFWGNTQAAAPRPMISCTAHRCRLCTGTTTHSSMVSDLLLLSSIFMWRLKGGVENGKGFDTHANRLGACFLLFPFRGKN